MTALARSMGVPKDRDSTSGNRSSKNELKLSSMVPKAT